MPTGTGPGLQAQLVPSSITRPSPPSSHSFMYSFSWHLSSTFSVLCAILDTMAKTAKVHRKPEVPAGEQAGNTCAGTRWGAALPAYWTFPRGSQTLTVGCLKQESCTQSVTRGSSPSGLHNTSPASHHLRSTQPHPQRSDPPAHSAPLKTLPICY